MAYSRRYRKKRSIFRRLIDYLSMGLIFVLVALAAAFFANKAKVPLSGPFKVADGDTLITSDERLRLEGIDAPEWGQKCWRTKNGIKEQWACGQASRNYLRKLVRTKTIYCVGYGVDKYERALVKCSYGNRDLNAEMVEKGWAVAYGDYYRLEAKARNMKVGIWQGSFDMPRDWRQENQGQSLQVFEETGMLKRLWIDAQSWFRQLIGS